MSNAGQMSCEIGNRDVTVVPKTHLNKWCVLAIVGATTFMSALDTSIVNIALPSIATHTRATTASLQWVVLSYLLLVTSTLLLFGRIADIFGQRIIYQLGQLMFGVSSLLCGLSHHIHVLVLFRAMQGVGAAMLFAVGPALLMSAFSPAERGKALGLQATMTYLGLSSGPALGGVLTQHFGWSAIFFVNVPVAATAFFASRWVLAKDTERRTQKLDWPGVALMGLALSSLLLGLTESHARHLTSPLVMGLLVLAATSAVGFVWVEKRSDCPALNIQLLSNPTFATSTLASMMCYSATAAMNFLLPFLLLTALRIPAAHAGLLLTATPLTMMFCTGPSGTLSDRIGVKIPTMLGMLLAVIGGGLLLLIDATRSLGLLIAAGVLVGMGAGLFTAPNNSAIMGSAPAAQRGVAGAILAAARTTGFAVGTAAAGLLYAATLGAVPHTETLPPARIITAVHHGVWAMIAFASLALLLSILRTDPRST